MSWTAVNFGKYTGKGKTLPEIIFEDPDYFFWGIENDIFNKPDELKYQSEILYSRIRAIKIPANDNLELVCEFIKNPQNERLEILQINDSSSIMNINCVYRKVSIDLGFPREYDTHAFEITKNLLPQLFLILFGNANNKPSKDICEEFFNYDDNFFL